THGAERAWRVPPSFNMKAGESEGALTSDRRRWRPVGQRYPSNPEGVSRVPEADLAFLAPFIQAAEDEESAAGSTHATAGPDFDPSVKFSVDLLPERLRRAWPMDDGGDQSDHDFAVACALADAGQPDKMLVAAIRARRAALASAEDRAKGE